MRLPSDFFAQDVLDAASALLGKVLCHQLGDGTVLCGRITETEAYCGEADTACHAHKGKTARTAVLYRPGGFSYVYLCYGMHNLLNIVTGSEGMPQAALIRGVEGVAPGPGRAAKFLQIDRALNDIDLRSSDLLWLEDSPAPARIRTATRVGIGYASAEDQARLWRFIAED